MCLLLISNNYHPDYKLIVAANRDEFYHRPTKKARFWNEHPELLAGKDLEAGGTWSGITKNGRFAAITNYRDMKSIKDNAPSRGDLVKNFLLSGSSPETFGNELIQYAQLYNGYNLLYSDFESTYYFSNQLKKQQKLSPGIYGLSNHLLDTPWPKVSLSKKSFTRIFSQKKFSADDLFTILRDDRQSPDNELPATGLSLELERAVSPVFIRSERYGTRSSTVLLVNKKDEVLFIEKSLDVKTSEWNESKFEFKIER